MFSIHLKSKGVEMDIIFKIIKYLKKNINLIKSVAIFALLVICIMQTINMNNYKSSYQEEKKSGSTIQTELDESRKQNKELETKLSDYEKIISGKDKKIQSLEEDVDNLKTAAKKMAEDRLAMCNSNDGYEQSTYIWTYLTEEVGLSDYVSAGIMGNIMAEVGGQTLDISRWPQGSNNGYYGICQWAGSRKDRLLNDFGTTLNDQVRFLSVELFEVIPEDNSFYNMQDEQEAALYFAKYYERCGSEYYYVRQQNSTKALEYFT